MTAARVTYRLSTDLMGDEAGHDRRSGIGVAPAPRREPDFDDEPARPRASIGRESGRLPFPRAAAPAPVRLLTAVAPLGAPTPRATARRDLPDPARFGRHFVQGVMEVLSGRRPAGQLAPYASMGVQAGLARDRVSGDRLGIGDCIPVLHSVRVMEPADGVAELCAVVQVASRYRAVAARLEGIDGRWRCVRLQIG